MPLGELTAKKKIPVYAFFELTRRCNLRCHHCYISRESYPELSTNKIKQIISQLKAENALILNFSGGEVFTRKDFFDIAWHAREEGFAIKLFTNGTLIDKPKTKEIALLKPLRVEITIFNLRPQIHDAITGVKGSLKKSLTALEILSENRVPLRIKSPLLKSAASGYKDIIKLAESLGAKYQFDPVIIPKTDGSRAPLHLRLDRKRLRAVLSDPKLSIREEGLRRNKDSIPCSAGHNSCAISAYGDVFPCIILPIKLGNLKQQSFSQIWRNSQKLSQLRAIRIKDLKDCANCRLLPGCNRCPGLAYLEDRDILAAPKRSCEIAEICKTFQK